MTEDEQDQCHALAEEVAAYHAALDRSNRRNRVQAEELTDLREANRLLVQRNQQLQRLVARQEAES